jgi:hypothetical protein
MAEQERVKRKRAVKKCLLARSCHFVQKSIEFLVLFFGSKIHATKECPRRRTNARLPLVTTTTSLQQQLSTTPQDQQKAKGEQKRKKGKRTNNSYCLFPNNDNCWRKFSKVK